MTTPRQYIPFGRPNFSQGEIDAVVSVMKRGWIGMGPEVIAFEKELADYLKVPHVVTLNSCTSALHLALLTSGVAADDEVICPSLTWCSSANAAIYVGAKPIFCDIDAASMCMSAETVRAKLTDKTKAVVVVHYGGYAVDIEAIRKILPPHVQIIEDAAHAFGSSFPSGKKVGASGFPTCFSFYANKNLSTSEGGAITLFDEAQANHIRSLRQHALPLDAWMRFTHPKTILLSNHLTELGYKMNYTDLQASIGRVQLARYDELQAIRYRIAHVYVRMLKETFPGLGFQRDILEPGHARHLFVIQLPKDIKMSREDLILALRAQNIGATIHYSPLHGMPLYNSGDGQPSSLPITEKLHTQLVTLPISASMSEDDAVYIAETMCRILL